MCFVVKLVDVFSFSMFLILCLFVYYIFADVSIHVYTYCVFLCVNLFSWDVRCGRNLLVGVASGSSTARTPQRLQDVFGQAKRAVQKNETKCRVLR